MIKEVRASLVAWRAYKKAQKAPPVDEILEKPAVKAALAKVGTNAAMIKALDELIPLPTEVPAKQDWDPAKSAGKAQTAANSATAGAIVGAGFAAAGMAAIRVLWPQILPWEQDLDLVLDGVITVVIARAWSWWQVFHKDRVKHTA
jgi:hypothetical protein